MKSIEVNSLPISEVISDLAARFDTDYTTKCNQHKLVLPEHIGIGTISGTNFENGLGVIFYNCNFKEDYEIKFVVNKVHPLKFLFCSQGTIEHRFENQEKTHLLDKFHNCIVASESYNGHILRFIAQEHTILNSLEVNRKVFNNKLDCILDEIDDKLKSLFKDINATKTFFYQGFYSYRVANLFEEIAEFTEDDFLKRIFLEGKSQEILTRQILQFQDDLKDHSERSILRQSEISLVHKAAEIVQENLSQNHTIESLSKKLGLNQKKLQKGFKSIFGTTVNVYVQRVRLKIAEDLLHRTDLSISEICYEIGISSKSYLSKVFKEKHNRTPSEYRELIRNQRGKDAKIF